MLVCRGVDDVGGVGGVNVSDGVISVGSNEGVDG